MYKKMSCGGESQHPCGSYPNFTCNDQYLYPVPTDGNDGDLTCLRSCNKKGGILPASDARCISSCTLSVGGTVCPDYREYDKGKDRFGADANGNCYCPACLPVYSDICGPYRPPN